MKGVKLKSIKKKGGRVETNKTHCLIFALAKTCERRKKGENKGKKRKKKEKERKLKAKVCFHLRIKCV